MLVAAVYDIHGNLPACEAVITEIRREKPDLIVVGGDVLPGPMPVETMECLLALEFPVRFIHGNGDREVVAAKRGKESKSLPEQVRQSLRWTADRLSTEHERSVMSWPSSLRVEIPELGEVLFCHATPRNDTQIFTKLTAEERLTPLFGELSAAVVVCGHTHMQFERRIGGKQVVNAGSVGMPFGDPGAYWLMLGPAMQFRRTGYDLAAAAARIGQTEYPQAREFAERNILHPPSEQEMLAVFSRVELQ